MKGTKLPKNETGRPGIAGGTARGPKRPTGRRGTDMKRGSQK